MSDAITVELGGVTKEVEAYVIHTDSGVNIELVDYPIVIDYKD